MPRSVRRDARSSRSEVRSRVSALGLGIVAAGWLAAVPVLVLAGCPLAAHALALTVVGGDGRVLCGL